MRRKWVLPPLVLLLGAAPGLEGQDRLAVVVRGGAAVPVGSFREEVPLSGGEPGVGPGFAVQFTIPRGTRRSLYVGFAQHRISCRGAGCEGAGVLVSTAWNLGVRLNVLTGGAAPWIQLGAVFDRTEADVLEGPGSVRRASDLAVGGEAGAGIRLRLGRRLSLDPGVRYARHDARFPGSGVVRMRYAVVDLGVVLAF